MIAVDLPIPPSINNAFVNAGRLGRIKSADYRAWRSTAMIILKINGAGQGRVDGAFEMQIALPFKMRGDIDNRVKGLIDLFVASGKIDDDQHLHKLTIWRDRGVPLGQCRVTVSTASLDVDGGLTPRQEGFSLLPAVEEVSS